MNDYSYPLARVDYPAYQQLVSEVAKHRQGRIVSFDQFLQLSANSWVIILDTRSRSLYEQKHISWALNLPFTEFTEQNLAKIIPSKDTTILIYCNNNIDGDVVNFADKSAPTVNNVSERITLALNIPTYINLYWYWYRNIYELWELVSIDDSRLIMGGGLNLEAK